MEKNARTGQRWPNEQRGLLAAQDAARGVFSRGAVLRRSSLSPPLRCSAALSCSVALLCVCPIGRARREQSTEPIRRALTLESLSLCPVRRPLHLPPARMRAAASASMRSVARTLTHSSFPTAAAAPAASSSLLSAAAVAAASPCFHRLLHTSSSRLAAVPQKQSKKPMLGGKGGGKDAKDKDAPKKKKKKIGKGGTDVGAARGMGDMSVLEDLLETQLQAPAIADPRSLAEKALDHEYAKEYSRLRMAEHRARQALEVDFLRQRWLAINALPSALRTEALKEDQTPWPKHFQPIPWTQQDYIKRFGNSGVKAQAAAQAAQAAKKQ